MADAIGIRETIEFPGPPSDEQRRKELQNIVDSYSHTWDILAELAQNAVDAIRAYIDAFGPLNRAHEITLTIDRTGRSLTIRDTGIGFDPSVVKKLLQPHATSKTSPRYIGEKGVGLTYVIFSCDYFELRSSSVSGSVEVVVTGASSWRRETSQQRPKLEIGCDPMPVDKGQTFTQITIQNVDRIPGISKDFFDLNDQTQQLILRTKTAIGNTDRLFVADQQPIENITFVLRDTEGHEVAAPLAFRSPADFLPSADVIDRDELVDKMAALDDAQKRKYLQKKTVRSITSKNIGGRPVKAYAFYAPFGMLRQINKSAGFDVTDDGEGSEDFGYQPGIFLATRGMPTGIELTHPRAGDAGYWSSLYIIIEDDQLPFDLGRKSVPPRTMGALREFAREIFQDLTRFAKYFSGATPPAKDAITPLHELSKRDEFNAIEKIPDLNVMELSFLKNPDRQEAGVAAIFHELVGRGILRGYRTLRVGYKLQYDLWCHYQLNEDHIGKNVIPAYTKLVKSHSHLDAVVEMKYVAQDIVDDFEENKFFVDIDLLVCWDFDEQELQKRQFMVTPLAAEDALFHGSNFVLSSTGTRKLGTAGQIPAICLRQFLQDLARKAGGS